MFNLSGEKLAIILIVALIVLGPDQLPDAVRKVARIYGELRRMSQGFQSELRDALDQPLREVRDTMNIVNDGFRAEATSVERTAREAAASSAGEDRPATEGAEARDVPS